MNYSLTELAKLINKKQNELNLSIENNENNDEIYSKSVELDNLIAEYYKHKQYDKTKKNIPTEKHTNLVSTKKKEFDKYQKKELEIEHNILKNLDEKNKKLFYKYKTIQAYLHTLDIEIKCNNILELAMRIIIETTK